MTWRWPCLMHQGGWELAFPPTHPRQALWRECPSRVPCVAPRSPQPWRQTAEACGMAPSTGGMTGGLPAAGPALSASDGRCASCLPSLLRCQAARAHCVLSQESGCPQAGRSGPVLALRPAWPSLSSTGWSHCARAFPGSGRKSFWREEKPWGPGLSLGPWLARDSAPGQISEEL